MIADEIQKAGQATIDQCTDLVTYKLTDTWTTLSTVTDSVVGALACNTGGNYWHDDDYGEWTITFTQDVCRYNGTPVKIYKKEDHGSGDYETYEVYDFAGNTLFYDQSAPTGTFTVRQIEYQNNKQSFQILDSGQPTYTDNYSDQTVYSESNLLNTKYVPSKSSCTGFYNRYLTDVSYGQTKTLKTISSGSRYRMLMIDAVQSDNYDWSSATYPAAGGNLRVLVKTTNTTTTVFDRWINFNYRNPGNMMVLLRPLQTATITVSASLGSGQTTNILCTIQEITV